MIYPSKTKRRRNTYFKMPYKYIGRKTDFKGKSLWELIGNLKNFGIGRIVYRNMFERYPEKSYMKILKVEALPNPEKPSMDEMRKVRVWVQNTFRGKTSPEPLLMEHISYKTDFRLVPKDEEQELLKTTTVYEHNKVLPKTMEFPPLLKELLIRNFKAKGEPIADLKLDIFYNKDSLNNKYRIAEDGEKPTVEVSDGLGKPTSPSLYEGIKL